MSMPWRCKAKVIRKHLYTGRKYEGRCRREVAHFSGNLGPRIWGYCTQHYHLNDTPDKKSIKKSNSKSKSTTSTVLTPKIKKSVTPKLIHTESEWPEGTSYRGVPIFDGYVKICEGVVDSYIEQEEYFGYIPSKDVFVMGIAGRSEIQVIKVRSFEVDKLNYTITDKIYFGNNNCCGCDGFESDSNSDSDSDCECHNIRFYHDGYNLLHELYPDTIDIRLD